MKSPPLILVAALLALTLTGCAASMSRGFAWMADRFDEDKFETWKDREGVVSAVVTEILNFDADQVAAERYTAGLSLPAPQSSSETLKLSDTEVAVIVRIRNIDRLVVCDTLDFEDCGAFGAFVPVHFDKLEIRPGDVSFNHNGAEENFKSHLKVVKRAWKLKSR